MCTQTLTSTEWPSEVVSCFLCLWHHTTLSRVPLHALDQETCPQCLHSPPPMYNTVGNVPTATPTAAASALA